MAAVAVAAAGEVKVAAVAVVVVVAVVAAIGAVWREVALGGRAGGSQTEPWEEATQNLAEERPGVLGEVVEPLYSATMR